MSLFTFNTAVNFRDLVGDIDLAGAGDLVSETVSDLFGFGTQTVTVFDLPGGLQATMTAVDAPLLGQVSTSIVILDGAGVVQAQLSVLGVLTYAGGIDLQAAIQAIDYDTPNYISTDPGAVIKAYGTDDEMLGQGRFLGGGGQDKIELESSANDGLGLADRSVAIGNAGSDILKAATELATMRGGGGADTLVVEFGRATLFGNAGSDSFVFDSGYYDGNGTASQADAAARVRVQDFAPGADELIFGRTDAGIAQGGAAVTQTLEDLFGAGDLSTLADFTIDGVDYRFRTASDGDAVLRRIGTDGDGRSYDERVEIEGVVLAAIDRSDVVLMDYNALMYELG